ncbi:MAG: LysM peptidoglycan-binding domain-containing protein, partial [Candidatus Krumholzibacteria bacterium]|nr:LysM peptidoglycan-binding domain-containing protein [Candidatus Krumholzibacteria bacterium]
TPPGMVVELKVPERTGAKCLERLAEIPIDKRVSWHRHRINRGETLSRIAVRYEISLTELKRINGIKNIHKIGVGKILLIPVKDADIAEKVFSEPGYRIPPKLPEKITMKRYKAPNGYRKIIYTVKDRDTLSEIAERFRTRLSRLRAWNELRYTSIIHPGDRLVIYVPPDYGNNMEEGNLVSNDPVKRGKRKSIHVVQKGETLSYICKLYKTSISDILAWNEGVKRDRLYPGDRIKIWLDSD